MEDETGIANFIVTPDLRTETHDHGAKQVSVGRGGFCKIRMA
jgi:hypothetical protein